MINQVSVTYLVIVMFSYSLVIVMYSISIYVFLRYNYELIFNVRIMIVSNLVEEYTIAR